jgi:asparagine synthase (glutamine-hydrolysing)
VCGLAGFLQSGGGEQARMEAMVKAMAATLHHRGPDDSGAWAEDACALGHRRLSVIDLSPQGHQPMFSHDGRWAIAYNGEFYNYQQMRASLEAHDPALQGAWRGTSDTEVFLEAVSRWGVDQATRQANGMFAFALWDRRERVLHLGRDRLGEKPLYYAWMGKHFLFGSELKALRAHPSFSAGIDRGALSLYMRHNYVPAPYCIYQGVAKLPPASLLTISPDQPGQSPEPRVYWSARQACEAGAAQTYAGSEDEALAELETLLLESVKMRMVADVSLGAFLSGGIDSSTVVALMQAQSTRPIKTFSIGFSEDAYNEAPYAKAVAQHLGTEHTELYVTPEQAMAVVPKLPRLYDEPFSDSSQIPTFLVAELARRHVTVSLSGDAGDELFGGYDRYAWGQHIWSRVGWLPYPARRMSAAILEALPQGLLSSGLKPLKRWLPEAAFRRDPGELAQRIAGYLKVRRPEDMYRRLVSHWRPDDGLVWGAQEPPTVLSDAAQWPAFSDLFLRMMYFDLLTYLPDDILVKVDRAAMAVSLESRIPFLDHRVVEMAWRLPLSMKVKGGKGKWLLRRLLYKYVPRELVERPKKGFGVPIDHWLRGPLKDWAAQLLAPERIQSQGFLNNQVVQRAWREHQDQTKDWHYWLWDVLMFQLWLEDNPI